MRLKDQVAIVTGGSRGIGRGIAQAFAREGAKVAVVYRGNQQAAEELIKELTTAGGTARAYQADVANLEQVEACVKKVEEELGPIDILVNSAGIIHDELFIRLEPDGWNKVLQTNLGGVYNFCKAVTFPMVRKRGGRIINISSVAASTSTPARRTKLPARERSTRSRGRWPSRCPDRVSRSTPSLRGSSRRT